MFLSTWPFVLHIYETVNSNIYNHNRETMKTSMIIIAALLLNTTLLVAEPLSTFVKGIDPFILFGVEALLILGFFANKWLKDLNKACTIDFGYLDIFVVKSK